MFFIVVMLDCDCGFILVIFGFCNVLFWYELCFWYLGFFGIFVVECCLGRFGIVSLERVDVMLLVEDFIDDGGELLFFNDEIVD